MIGAPLPVGSPAPQFAAHDHTGEPVSLDAFRGHHVVLVFYPGDDTPTCTCQLGALRDAWSDVQMAGAVVYGVNPFSEDSHRKFAEKIHLPYPLIPDRGGRIARAYRSGFWLLVRRTVYVIGPDGRIVLAERGMPSVDRILAAIKGSYKS